MIQEIMNKKDFKVKTDRLEITPVHEMDAKYYFKGFNERITKYQYPEPFESVEAATAFIKEFTKLRLQGIHLVANILNEEKYFVGSVEVHAFDTDTPELGIWIAEPFQRRGYAYEVLKGVMRFIDEHRVVNYFIYEADRRNRESTTLAHKLGGEFCDYNEVMTPSGKILELNTYKIQVGAMKNKIVHDKV